VEVVKSRDARVKIMAHKDGLTWGLARQAGEWQTYTDAQLIRSFEKSADDVLETLQAEAEADDDQREVW
jgi:hypothetical protein